MTLMCVLACQFLGDDFHGHEAKPVRPKLTKVGPKKIRQVGSNQARVEGLRTIIKGLDEHNIVSMNNGAAFSEGFMAWDLWY